MMGAASHQGKPRTQGGGGGAGAWEAEKGTGPAAGSRAPLRTGVSGQACSAGHRVGQRASWVERPHVCRFRRVWGSARDLPLSPLGLQLRPGSSQVTAEPSRKDATLLSASLA